MQNKTARVFEILIAGSPLDPPASVAQAKALPGSGLEGDRYANGAGTFSKTPHRPDGELTLIEKENIDAFTAETGIPFRGADARRNIVTEGVDLNSLVGRDFKIGDVRIRAIRLCEPCDYLAKQTSPEVLPGLARKGGIRAQILTAGEIRVGDPIEV